MSLKERVGTNKKSRGKNRYLRCKICIARQTKYLPKTTRRFRLLIIKFNACLCLKTIYVINLTRHSKFQVHVLFRLSIILLFFFLQLFGKKNYCGCESSQRSILFNRFYIKLINTKGPNFLQTILISEQLLNEERYRVSHRKGNRRVCKFPKKTVK